MRYEPRSGHPHVLARLGEQRPCSQQLRFQPWGAKCEPSRSGGQERCDPEANIWVGMQKTGESKSCNLTTTVEGLQGTDAPSPLLFWMELDDEKTCNRRRHRAADAQNEGAEEPSTQVLEEGKGDERRTQKGNAHHKHGPVPPVPVCKHSPERGGEHSRTYSGHNQPHLWRATRATDKEWQ